MTGSASLQAIEAQKERNFRHLQQNGIDRTAFDAFESFIRDPATLDRESLVLRCRFSHGKLETRVVLDRKKSQGRKAEVEPFLRRNASRFEGESEVFILISDTISVAEAKRAEFVRFLKTVPFLRSDWLDGDDVSEHAIVIPDCRLQAEDYAEDLAAVCAAAERTPYDDRAAIIGWRGRLSGPAYPDLDNCEIFPRYHLLRQAGRHPEIVEIGVTNFTNFPDTEAGRALRREIEAMVGPPVPELRPEEFVRYRYLLAADGVAAPWKTVPMRMATGSVVLMQSRWNQYFSVALDAWHHYVPLRNDFGDLVDRYAWLRDNPEEALAIALAGQAFVNSVLTPALIDDFFVGVLARCRDLARDER